MNNTLRANDTSIALVTSSQPVSEVIAVRRDSGEAHLESVSPRVKEREDDGLYDNVACTD